RDRPIWQCTGGRLVWRPKANHSSLGNPAIIGKRGWIMALVHALLGQWMPTLGASLGRRKVGKVILHGQSRRAYAFEVHHAQAGDGLSDVPAVYIYARTPLLSPPSPPPPPPPLSPPPP